MQILQLRDVRWRQRARLFLVFVSLISSVSLARAIPVITEVSPLSGPPGTSVTIRGSDLGKVVDVRFGPAPALFVIANASLITTTVPLDGISDFVSVAAPSGNGVSPKVFHVGPRIYDFSPTNAPVGAAVQIRGDNFENTSSVWFGDFQTSFSVTSPSQITAAVPKGATNGPIGVITPAGWAQSVRDFEVTAGEPFIGSFSPTKGGPGTTVTLEGANFVNVTAVMFDTLKATSVNVTSPTQMRATVPPEASSGFITVSNKNGGGTSVAPFIVSSAPIVDQFSPLGGAPGTLVVINGDNFTGATAVRFGNNVSVKPSVTAATQLNAVVPSGAAIGPISITTPSGTGISSWNFYATTAPIITRFHPDTAAPLTLVTIEGINFTKVRAVRFNGFDAANFSANAVTQISATVPSKATNGPITVITDYGTNTSAQLFLVRTGKPMILDFDPPAGATRATVKIDGLDFTGATAVRFNGAPAQSFSVVAESQISAVVPDNATTGPVTVTTPAGSVTSTNAFVVAPRLTSFSPASGGAGAIVELRGTNLLQLNAVRIGLTRTSFENASSNEVTFIVPDEAVTESINVINPAGIVATTNYFYVLPTLRQFSPVSGGVGTTVTILGTGFTDATTVRFGGVYATSYTPVSATEVRAVVPVGAISGPITVTTGSGSAVSGQSFIVGPAIDLEVRAIQTTNALLVNQVMTYTLSLTNRGPSTASTITLLDTLPGALTLRSVQSNQGTVTTSGTQVRVDFGSLASGTGVQVFITTLATSTGAITNTVSVSAREPDLDPADNAAFLAATIVANPAVMRIDDMPDTRLRLAWPVTATNFVPYAADVLSSQTQWQPLGIVPMVSGSSNMVTVPNTGARRYFRLQRP
jgi:uncharacterized repeat protein (TIGR01451 family)